MAENHAKIMRFTQPLSRSLNEYAELQWAKVLQCNRVYDAYVIKANFIERIGDFILRGMRSFWSPNKHATLKDLARQAISLTNAMNGLCVREGTRCTGKHKNRHERKEPKNPWRCPSKLMETLLYPSMAQLTRRKPHPRS